MNRKQLIQETASHVRMSLVGAEPGHDWWHTQRVWANAVLIQQTEGGDLFVVELAALLHDIADYKFHGGDEEIGPTRAREWLSSIGVDTHYFDPICGVIRNMNFKGSAGAEEACSLEHAIVQDADRLDAIGAVGIARCFSFGGHFGREIFNPEIPAKDSMTGEEYRRSKSPSINHFFEKLLLLRDRMLTETGKMLAAKRHDFMKIYLSEFFEDVKIQNDEVHSEFARRAKSET